MLKIPSLQHALNETGYTLKRFPLPLLCTITAVFSAIFITHGGYSDKDLEQLWKVIMCCSLGLNLTLAAQLFSESRSFGKTQNILLQSASVTLLLVYYFLMPDFKDFTLKDGIRYALFSIGSHLLVSFSPFIANDQKNGFWQFNKSLFLRFLTASLYSGVLYVGLALAILAVDELFKADINGKWYVDLWFILAGIFNTCFFLTGVPKQTQTLETETAYPKGLKIFTQFVLLPLVAIYLLILYAYSIKIAISMELPRGWVSYLVIGFSVAGILSLLLIWPIRYEKENSWIQITYKWFYRALYPLIILLCLAIYKRVSEYGITENRYFVLIVAIWLTCIASYFLLSKVKNIKIIPISLCVIALLSSFGPLGVFRVSERSQVNRLEKLLIDEKILVDGKIKKSDSLLQNKNSEKIESIVNYLHKNHGFKAIQPWFTQNFDSLFSQKDSRSRYVNKTGIVLDLMGVAEYTNYSVDEINSVDEIKRTDEIKRIKDFYINVASSHKLDRQALNIKGFDYYSTFYTHHNVNSSYEYDEQIVFGNDSIFLKLDENELLLFSSQTPTKKIDLTGFVRTLQKNHPANYTGYIIPPEEFVLSVETDSLLVHLKFRSISGETDENDSTIIKSINTAVLIKLK